jgi:hypothetical protein
MKIIFFVAGIFLAFGVSADELIQMTNGMACWRNDSGFIYGCSGGVDTGDRGFNDTRTGTRYEPIGGDNAVDARTGQTFNIPDIHRNDQQNDE